MRIKKKDNYFDFDTIFLFAYFFLFFCYPVFIYPIDPTRLFMFKYDFNEDVINKSTALALAGIESYFIGSVFIKRNNYHSIPTIINANIYFTIAAVIYIIVNFVYYSLNPFSWYAEGGDADPSASHGIFGYIKVFGAVLVISAIISEFYYIRSKNNTKWYKHNLFLWVFVLIYVVSFLRFGSRGTALQVFLVIVACISVLYDGMRFKTFLLLICLGALMLNIIMILRSRNVISFSANILDVMLDLIVCNRNTYLAVDYVNNYGVLIPPILGTLFDVIPFLKSIFFGTLKISLYQQASTIFFSYLTMGNNMTFGVGSNIIASLYLSSGLCGVILGMFFLGYIIAYLRCKFNINSYYGSCAYLSMMSYAIFLVRADYFIFLRQLLWCLLLLYIFSSGKTFKFIYAK
jgi:oligosaccharide repeat unit polymerase